MEVSEVINVQDNAQYVLHDEDETVELLIKVPESVNKSDIKVAARREALTVSVQNAVLLNVERLYAPIRADETVWFLEPGTLKVALAKYEAVKWPRLSADAKEAIDGGEALSQREMVRVLLEAAHVGDVDNYVSLVGRFEPGDLSQVKDGNGRNVLHFAAQSGRLAMVQHIIQHDGVDVNCQDDAGETALALAALNGHEETVRWLIDVAHADVNCAAPDGAAPLHRAAACGNVRIATLLLEHGAPIDHPSVTGTPLLWAAGEGKDAMVAFLLDRGADVNAATKQGVTALHMACAAGSVACLQLLLQRGAAADAAAEGDLTSLAMAAAMHPEPTAVAAVKLLIEHGADANVVDASGLLPIQVAALEHHRDVVAALLPHTTAAATVASDWTIDGIMAAATSWNRALATEDDGVDTHDANFLEGQVEIPEPPQPDATAAAACKSEGDGAFRRGDYAAAADAYTRALRHDTQFALVWGNRSAARLKLHDADAALHDARVAIKLDATYVKGWFRMGAALAAKQQWEQAAQAYFEAYRLDPSNDAVEEAFTHAIAEGRKQHQEQQQQLQQQQQQQQ